MAIQVKKSLYHVSIFDTSEGCNPLDLKFAGLA